MKRHILGRAMPPAVSLLVHVGEGRAITRGDSFRG